MSRILLTANTDWYLYNFRLALAKFLRDQGHTVFMAAPTGKYTPRLQHEGFGWHAWELGRQSMNPVGELRSIRILLHIVQSVQPQVLHNHTIKPLLYGSLVGRLVRIPAIINSVTGRGYVFISRDRRARWLRRMLLPVYRLALQNPQSGGIFENSTDLDFFIEHRLIPPDRAWLIKGVGVDPERFYPTPEPPGVPQIVFPARMLWDKGVGVLIEAARILKSRREANFVLVGEPDPGNPASISADQLESWQADGLIEWRGWQTDMPAVYQDSHIVVLPTMYGEGVPTVLLEGAASGRPLIATDIPGCRQIVYPGENGFLIPPGDSSALADALEKLIRDPALRGRMGSISRQIVLRQFTHAQVNAETLAVYQYYIQPKPDIPT